MAPNAVDPSRLPVQQPGSWRLASSLVMGLTGAASSAFLYGLNTVQVHGLDRFLHLLDQRKDVEKRQRGLITVSNHISILDDPLMWGVLPLRYAFHPSNLRWGLGAHDICFKNNLLGSFFFYGQVLPAHRLQHSPHGGLFQPTMTQAIRLLSSQPFISPQPATKAPQSPHDYDISDPFTGDALAYTTTGSDQWPAPSAYAQNKYSWVHVFPEACVHQHPNMYLRYFKWGISRLILESEPMPDVLPIFIDGTQRVMPEDRKWPRFVPRFGTTIRVAFGELLDVEKTFGDLRARWQELVRKEMLSKKHGKTLALGELTDDLKYGQEAVHLRVEVARRVRGEVMKVRRSLGYPDEEVEGLRLEDAETWAREPAKDEFKSNVDQSLVNKKE
ncbi:hypothetical protein F4778DRAFT_741244 [Xylariomycetidae sp. FL2044]|nr:hypothetical protein F4778DRAFT_741244 [Xylariomycetidae sp. FL2044]